MDPQFINTKNTTWITKRGKGFQPLAHLHHLLYICIVQVNMNAMLSIAMSELRAQLKQILESVKSGKSYKITQRGEVVAVLQPPATSEEDLQSELDFIRSGSTIHGDIIDTPLPYDEWGDDDSINIAADPKKPYE